MSDYQPARWHKELEIFRNVKSLILLEGNIHDSCQYPDDSEIPAGSVLRLPEYLYYFFRDRGYETIVFYDAVQGFSNPYQNTDTERFSSLVDVPEKQNLIPAPSLSPADDE